MYRVKLLRRLIDCPDFLFLISLGLLEFLQGTYFLRTAFRLLSGPSVYYFTLFVIITRSHFQSRLIGWPDSLLFSRLKGPAFFTEDSHLSRVSPF